MAIIISVIMGKQERLDNLLEPNHAIHSFLKELQLSLFSRHHGKYSRSKLQERQGQEPAESFVLCGDTGGKSETQT